MSKGEIASMTCREAADVYQRNPVVLIPLGSMEEHGPTSPVGDFRIIDAFCRGIVERTENAIMVPTLPFGYSEVYRNFPGCITFQPETLTAAIEDVLDSLVSHGLDHIVLACGHHGNMPILEHLARRFKLSHGLRLVTVEPLRWFTPELLLEVYGTDTPQTGHGSDPIMSIMMYLSPDDVRPDLAEKDRRQQFLGFDLRSTSEADFGGVPVQVYADMEDLTPNGVLGDIGLASAERGEKIMEFFIKKGVAFVECFKDVDTHIG